MKKVPDEARKQIVVRRRESGNVLILATLSIFVLFGFMGLVLDAGYMYFHKRRMQTAADAAAIGGAQEVIRNSAALLTTVQAAGHKDSSINGFTDQTTVDGGAVSVAINMPPLYGPRAGQLGFVEAIVTQPQPTMFMRLLNINTATVAARAVAGASTGTGCVYAMNSSPGNTGTQYGFFLNGSVTMNMKCGIYSNSNFNCTNGATVNMDPIDISYSNPGGYTGGGCGPPGMLPSGIVDDPVKSLSFYTTAKAAIVTAKAGSCDHTNYKVPGGATFTVPPGTYCGGITVDGSSADLITFSAGNYFLVGGGMKVTAGSALTGDNVTFFVTYPGTDTSQYAPVTINGSGTVTFAAPTAAYGAANSSAIVGLLFFQDPSFPPSTSTPNTSIIAGSGASTYNGIIYYPTTDLVYTGSSTNVANSSAGYTILIGYDVKVNGGSTINSDYTAIGGNPFKVATFVE
jgi:hypothetical protein